MNSAARPRALNSVRAFVLLEVMVAIVVLSVAMVALLRGFTVGMHSVRENRIILTASLLADALMEDYEIEPPDDGRKSGNFVDDARFGEAFASFTWERDVREVEVDYRKMPKKTLQDPEPLYKLELNIRYDDGRNRSFVPVTVTTYLMESQLYTDGALQANQLF